MACGSSGSGDPGGNPPGNVGNSGGTYKSNYCVAEDVVEESDDTYVIFDGLSYAPDRPAAVENASSLGELTDVLLYTNLLLTVSSADFAMGFGPILAPGFCDTESTTNNQCDLTNADALGIKTVGGVANGVLTFDLFTKSASSTEFDVKASTYSSKVFPHWEGTYELYGGDASDVSLITWRRDASAEYYSATSENGDFTNVTEQSDCSGTISTQRTNTSNGSVTTTDGSWQINGTTTTGQATQCTDSECNSFMW